MPDEGRFSLLQSVTNAIAEAAAFYKELDGESPRAAVILAVASLEDELEKLIRSKFPDDVNKALWDALAGPGMTPFGSLKAKADVAQAFGFFGNKTRKTIERIASIRNKFAHEKSVRSFDHPLIRKKCKTMEANPVFPMKITDHTTEDDLRKFYISAVRTLEEKLAEAKVRTVIDPHFEPLP